MAYGRAVLDHLYGPGGDFRSHSVNPGRVRFLDDHDWLDFGPSFQIGYTIFQIPSGWLGDRFGPRRALTVIVAWWSAFTALTALMFSAGSMIVCRFLFGVGESGAFPIATRSLSNWMLPSERGWAQGATHAGSRLGGALTPIIVAAIIALWGWRAPFLIFALFGVVWGVVWFFYYRDTPEEHASPNEEERELIRTSLNRKVHAGGKPSVPWKRILTNPQMWLLSVMYACYGYSINIYLSWFPKYLVDTHNMDLTTDGHVCQPAADGRCRRGLAGRSGV